VVRGQEPACTSDAGLYLIEDEERSAFAAQRLDAGKIARLG
jgi:hypothetical protein